MDGMRKEIEGIDLERSSLLADNEFMALLPCLFLFVRHVASHAQAPETWSSRLLISAKMHIEWVMHWYSLNFEPNLSSKLIPPTLIKTSFIPTRP